MTSKIIVNNIQSDTGISTITISSPIALSGGVTGGGFAVGTGASIGSPATNVLTLGTNNVERVRVDSSGHFIMPAVRFDLMVGDSTDSNAGTQTISVGSTASGSSGGIQLWANPTNGNSWVQFGDNSASASQYRGWVNYQHADDNLNFGTAGTERLRIDSSGRVTTPYQVYFYARTSGSGNHTSGTLPYSVVDYNIGNHYNTSTYTFTAPVAGVYCISFQFFSLVNAAGGADLVVNGVLTMRCGREGTETYYEGYSNSINKYLNTNDTVNVQLYTGTIHLNTPFSHFSAYLLG